MTQVQPHLVFRAAEEKLKRAFEDLKTLRTYASVFEKTRQYRCAVNFEANTGWWVVKARILQEPGPEFGVLIGAIAYQCLSAFNILVWELAARKVGRRRVQKRGIREHVQIPISHRAQDFNSLMLVSKRLVSKRALTILEGLQPYTEGHGPRGPHEHPLPLIKEIADSDKHRVLTPAFVQMDMRGVALTWDDPASGPVPERALPFGSSITDGTVLARIRFRHGNREANVRVDPEPTLALMFATDSWSVDVPMVEGLAKWTYDAIHRCAPLFPSK